MEAIKRENQENEMELTVFGNQNKKQSSLLSQSLSKGRIGE